MNSDQAKRLDLPDLLSRLGYQPVKVIRAGREFMYRVREEKTGSLHVSRGQKLPWVWYDFNGECGTVLDFAMWYWKTDVKGALSKLREEYRSDLFHVQKQERVGDSPNIQGLFSEEAGNDNERQNIFLRAHKPKNRIIFQYLAKRGIPAKLVDLYLYEVWYFRKDRGRGKEYFGFGMKNESGGYEIRAASDEYRFKSSLIKHDITLVQGFKPDVKSVAVFEGMTDFLSLLVYCRTERLKGDALILNSLSSYKRSVSFIREKGYGLINTFLDNDDGGRKYTEKFIDDFGDIVHSQSTAFAGHKDLNKALIERHDLSL